MKIDQEKEDYRAFLWKQDGTEQEQEKGQQNRTTGARDKKVAGLSHGSTASKAGLPASPKKNEDAIVLATRFFSLLDCLLLLKQMT